ncbi:MAG: FkbM family methyltransferase [Candidatus Poseidoniales archaeon]|jgi:FkbM family methyltransferase
MELKSKHLINYRRGYHNRLVSGCKREDGDLGDDNKKSSFPIRAFKFGLRIPGRLYNRYITYPLLDKALANSDIDVYVHDKERDLLRIVTLGERLNWSLKTGKACDAVPWLDRISPLINAEDTIFDVGGNIGVIAHWFSTKAKLVHAFEPHPDNIAIIESQSRLRNASNLHLHKYAVGQSESEMDLCVKGFHGHHSLGDVNNSPTIGHIKVQVRTLDNIANDFVIPRINFLKIDVEGFEADVLIGAKQLLSERRIDYVLFEMKESILSSIKRTPDEVFAPLLEAGYQIITLEGILLEGGQLSHPPDADYLACLDVEATAEKLATSKYALEY